MSKRRQSYGVHFHCRQCGFCWDDAAEAADYDTTWRDRFEFLAEQMFNNRRRAEMARYIADRVHQMCERAFGSSNDRAFAHLSLASIHIGFMQTFKIGETLKFNPPTEKNPMTDQPIDTTQSPTVSTCEVLSAFIPTVVEAQDGTFEASCSARAVVCVGRTRDEALGRLIQYYCELASAGGITYYEPMAPGKTRLEFAFDIVKDELLHLFPGRPRLGLIVEFLKHEILNIQREESRF